MTISIPDFRTRFPEFSDEAEYPDARVQLFIDDTICDMGTDEGYWCGKYDVAQAYLTAHLLTIGTLSEVGGTSANAGTIQSKSAGGVSVSRAVVAQDRSTGDEFYMGTIYGQRFLMIRNTCFPGVIVANEL